MDDLSDDGIVELFFARDERAIGHTEKKYGALILSVCMGILHNHEDAEECSSSVYYAVWKKIPPERPRSLPAFLCTLARGFSIDRYREKTRQKRAGILAQAPFEELENLFSQSETPEEHLERNELCAIINEFLSTLEPDQRRLFVRRYYFEEDVDRIAASRGVSRRTVYVRLGEIRDRLEKVLRKEGYLR